MSPTSRFDTLPEARGVVIQQVPTVAEKVEVEEEAFDKNLREELNYIHNHMAEHVTLDLPIKTAMPPINLTQEQQQAQSGFSTGYYAKQNLNLNNSMNKLRTQLVASKYLQK